MQTVLDPHTRRLLGELINCGRNAANPTGLMKRTGIARSTSYAISLTRPRHPATTKKNVRVTAGGVALTTARILLEPETVKVAPRLIAVGRRWIEGLMIGARSNIMQAFRDKEVKNYAIHTNGREGV
jgi:hypothetical protein